MKQTRQEIRRRYNERMTEAQRERARELRRVHNLTEEQIENRCAYARRAHAKLTNEQREKRALQMREWKKSQPAPPRETPEMRRARLLRRYGTKEEQRERKRVREARTRAAMGRTYALRQTARRYGLGDDSILTMKKEQNNRCAICETEFSEESGRSNLRIACVDHDHDLGHVRKLLCRLCNLGLGGFRDNPSLLRAAADYLEHHGKPV